MTVQEILREIPRLTTREQLLVLQALSHALHAEFSHTAPPSGEAQTAITDRLYGAFNPDRQSFSDEDIERIRAEAMREKYS
jgi:hypothetical protein